MRDKVIIRPLPVLIVLYVLAVIFGAGYARAANYAVAVDGTKPFESETTIERGQQITFDVYLQAAPGGAFSGGAFIDFSASTNRISYVSASVANPPWAHKQIIFNELYGPGTLIFIVINLYSTVPDADGDMILGTVALECTGLGDASINITTIPEPEFQTWGPLTNGWNDDAINTATVNPVLVIHQIQICTQDEDCDDEFFCNGVETCDVGGTNLCQLGTPEPDDTFCDDSDACTEGDVCSNGSCAGVPVVCPDDGVFCNGDEYCDEVTNCSSYGNPCSVATVCNESTDSCDIDIDEDGIADSQDNCLNHYNPDQQDADGDGVGNICDNCTLVDNPNQDNSDNDPYGDACDNCPSTDNEDQLDEGDGDGVGNICDNCTATPNPDQLDTYPPQGNGIGDACDCECDFACDGDVDADDVSTFLWDFGRSEFNNPCTNTHQCFGDVDCNTAVDADDVTMFLQDFGRSQFNNPCPACEVGDWCVYE